MHIPITSHSEEELAQKLGQHFVMQAVAQEPRLTQSARPAAAEEQQVDLVDELVQQMKQCGKREDAERMELMVRRSLGSRMTPQQQRQLDSVQTYYQEREQMLMAVLQKSPSSLIRQLVLRQFNLGEDATMDELMKMI